MDNAVETVNEYHKNLDSLVDCSVTEFESRDITINPSIEGKTKSIMVKGWTYQNLWDINKVTLSTSVTKDNGYIKISANENNVYIYMKEEATLTFPGDIKWETLSEFGKGDYVEIILTYVKTNGVGQWLGSAIVYNG